MLAKGHRCSCRIKILNFAKVDSENVSAKHKNVINNLLPTTDALIIFTINKKEELTADLVKTCSLPRVF